ncbi:MAG: hypothetical protein C4306_10165 [Thermoleophilia bacterium]
MSSRTLSLPTRAVTVFSGAVGLTVKILLLSIVNAVAIWACAVLVLDGKWFFVGAAGAATLAVDAIYLLPRRLIPLKFLVPGTVFLLAFQVIPIAYNVNVAFTNWATGHILTKSEAIRAIEEQTLEPPFNGKSYVMAPASDADGSLVLVLVEEGSRRAFLGTRTGLQPLAHDQIRLAPSGAIAQVSGYRLIKGRDLASLDRELSSFTVPTGPSTAIRPEGLGTALELRKTLRYDPKRDVFIRLADGRIFRDNGRGSFASGNEELEPGWRADVGLDNFRRLARDPLIQKPFLRVLAWTFMFATLTVLLSFALGLLVAIALNRPGMRFLRVYRSLLVLPYAVPAFLSILVWRGLLNDEFGLVNRLLPFSLPWLFDPTWAKASVILVSVWLTVPYFFLVSLGALQSIPGELVEAARVDGGSPWQIFRRVTLPLLLVAVAPLMIASFAFNFNNFNNIYLLTGGGPTTDDQTIAGATDILISYTWKLAFQAGKGQDYGLASAISIVIFFVVATISALSFWRSRSLEELR